MKFFLLGFLSFSVVASSVFASGDHGETKSVGHGASTVRAGGHLAVQAYDAEEGFKLSLQAIQSFGIAFQKLGSGSRWTVPKDSLVRIKHSSGVYRQTEEGWITFVLVKTLGQNGKTLTIESDDLQAGDSVASQGAAYLRMTEADLASDTVDSCSH